MFLDPCEYPEPVEMNGGQVTPAPPPAPTPTPTPTPTPPIEPPKPIEG